MKANKVINGNSVLTVEFGKITKVPVRQGKAPFPSDAVAYARGVNGANDVFVPLFIGRQVRAGLDLPELQKERLRPELAFGDEIFFFRNGRIPEALFWGLTKYFDKAVLEIAERPMYRVSKYTYLRGQLTSGDQGGLIAAGSLGYIAAFAKSGGLPARIGEFTFVYRWEAGLNGVWKDCENPFETPAPKPAPVQPVGPVTEVVAAASPEVLPLRVTEVVAQPTAVTPLGPVTEVIAVNNPEVVPSEEVPLSEREVAALLSGVNRNAGVDNTGEFRRETTRAERRRARREVAVS